MKKQVKIEVENSESLLGKVKSFRRDLCKKELFRIFEKKYSTYLKAACEKGY
jgi:hypothetical protein